MENGKLRWLFSYRGGEIKCLLTLRHRKQKPGNAKYGKNSYEIYESFRKSRNGIKEETSDSHANYSTCESSKRRGIKRKRKS